MANRTDFTDTYLIAAIRKHAISNYNRGGWDYIVECWDDASILDAIDNCGSITAAIAKLGRIVKVKDEYRSENMLGGEW